MARRGIDRAAGTYLALLRGINLGGKNKLPMKDLARLFEELGCRNVRTYIQSGNVVFEGSAELARRVPPAIQRAIAARLGLRVPVLVRSSSELARVIERNPYLRGAADPSALHVMFLADRPDAKCIAALDPLRSPPDEFVVLGREVYLRCPNGVARSKLTNAYFDSRLATISTSRNWSTVGKLGQLAAGAGGGGRTAD